MPTAYNQGQPIHYAEIGTGEPVVLLHAFMNDHQIWMDMGYTRALRDYHLILPDHRGYGTPSHPYLPMSWSLPLHRDDDGDHDHDDDDRDLDGGGGGGDGRLQKPFSVSECED